MSTHSLYKPLNQTVKLIWLYGPSGCGKTFTARKKYPKAFVKGPNCDWKGYNNEDTVIIDDVDVKARRPFLVALINWLDSHPFSIMSHYKKSFIRPRRIVVLSCSHPCEFKHLRPFIPKIISNCRILYCGNNSQDSPLHDTQPYDEDDKEVIHPNSSPSDIENNSDYDSYSLSSSSSRSPSPPKKKNKTSHSN